MSQCVPSWYLEDFNLKNDVFKLGYEVAELTWKNGQLAMHELGPRRVANKSQPSNSWDKPRAPETLEAIVNQATHLPYNKPHIAVNENKLVPWLNLQPHDKPMLMTSDGLVPTALDACCSTRVGSCSADPSVFVATRRVAPENEWNSSNNISVSESESGSGRDGSKSTLPDDSAYHCTTQWETVTVKEKKRGKAKSSISNKRKRTAAIHNQSERKRRDKINQRMNTLQKLVPNSSKTDKASMLDEVIEYIKQLQAQVHMVNRMNISPMMLPLVMQQQQQQQQQQQMQLSMMNSMGMGMGMGIGMGGMDMNTIGLSNMPSFLPSSFMHMPSWNSRPTNQVINTATMNADPISAFLACQSQPVNMDSYNRMAALYQHMQTQPPSPFHKK